MVSWPYQHVTEVVWARAEAAGLRVFRTAGARVQKGARVQTVCNASHAGELLQEVSSHAHGLRGQVAWGLPKDAAEGTVQYIQHWRNRTFTPFLVLLRPISELSGQVVLAISPLSLLDVCKGMTKLKKSGCVCWISRAISICQETSMLNCFLKFYLFCNWVIKSKESWVLCAESAELTERLQCKHTFPEFAHGREYLTCKAGCQQQDEMPEESTFKVFPSLQFWLLPIRNTILSQMLHAFPFSTITGRPNSSDTFTKQSSATSFLFITKCVSRQLWQICIAWPVTVNMRLWGGLFSCRQHSNLCPTLLRAQFRKL